MILRIEKGPPMKRLITALLLVVTMPCHASADSAAEAESLPFKEFSRIVEERKVSLDADATAVILEFVDGLDPAPPKTAAVAERIRAKITAEAKAVAERLRDGNATISLGSLQLLLRHRESRAICVKLGNYKDPVLKFLANAALTGRGDSKAAGVLHGLIHNQSFSTIDKRFLKTCCDSIGIQANTDDADKILDHLTAVMNMTPKFKAGDTAPYFSAVTMRGRKLLSKEFKGKVIVLHFWSTNCGPCMAQMPSHIETLSKYSSDEIAILFVSLDEDKDKCKAAVDKYKMPFNNVHGARGLGCELARLFGVNALPFDIVIDGNGKVVSNSIDDVDAAVAQKQTP